MWRGEVPYRDFGVEYPPGALPFFFLPAYKEAANVDSFRQSFEALIAACMAVLLIGMALSLAALRASPLRTFGALALAAVAPLLLGSVILSRFDLWPATLVALATAALLSGRLKLGHALLGAGIAAKLWPGVLVPLAVAYAWRTRGRREGIVCLGIARCGRRLRLPPVRRPLAERRLPQPPDADDAAAPDRDPRRRVDRRSHHVLGTGVVMSSGHGSQNIGGTAANVVAGIQTAIQVGALLAHLDRVRAPRADRRGARALLGRGGRRVHRARQGALPAVSDLADPARAARAQMERSDPLRGRSRADAGLVSAALLGLRAAIRRDALVARAGQGRDPRGAARRPRRPAGPYRLRLPRPLRTARGGEGARAR